MNELEKQRIKEFKRGEWKRQEAELKREGEYIAKQGTSFAEYRDYRQACIYLGLDMTDTKNRFPADFKYWHDVRIDEYHTAKAQNAEKERKELWDKFEEVSEKYMGLQYNRQSDYVAVIARTPDDLVREGEILHHCVGRMNYDQKFAREETLIFFIRTKSNPDEPFVTVEYSPSKKKVLQCYGDSDSNPPQEVRDFVYGNWLAYVNRKIKKITKEGKVA